MRKYFLIVLALVAFQQSFSQDDRGKKIRKEIDSMERILPTLTGTIKVGCLNTIAHKFFEADLPSIEQQMDSSYKYVMMAFAEAKRIGYKKGLGYAYARLISIDNGRFNASGYAGKSDSSFLKDAQKNIDQTIHFGKELHDNTLLGIANWKLAWLAAEYKNTSQYIEYLKKTIFYFEKIEKVPQGGYKEQDYADCNGCNGNEIWLGEIYEELTQFYCSLLDYKSANTYSTKAIEYINKIGDKRRLAQTYSYLAWIHFRGFNYKASENASIQAIALYNELGDHEKEIWTYAELGKVFEIPGDFESGLEYSKKSISVAESLLKTKTPTEKIKSYWGQPFFWTCRLYKIAGDYEAALDIIRRGKKYYPDPMDDASIEIWASEIGDVHRLLGNYDSAFFYLNRFSSINERWDFGKVSLGYLYLDLKEYDKALELVTPVIQKLRKLKPMPPLANFLIIASNASYKKGDYLVALNYAKEAQVDLNLMKGNVLMIKNNKLLSEIFNKLGRDDSAYFYLNKYTTLKDSLLNRQFYFKLSNYKKEAEEERKTSQINLLNKENQLKEQKLKQQATLRNSLIAGILLLFLLGFFIFRNLLLKRKNEKLRLQKDLEVQQLESAKKQAELHQRAVELEMQALRAQMNPHFIFNCLSSINRFIFKNDNKAASDYLTRFSRLIRMVLMHSQKKLIPLEDELEMLRLYLDLERLRFKDAFDYSITTTNIVDAGAIFIPPLLLQPFCENAVWHGLMHKDSKGHLNVIISEVINENEKVLHCIIEDDGVGRDKAAEMKSKSAGKEKSMGLKITTERLALLNRENNFSTFYKIEDILNEKKEVAGTRVQLKIKYKENVEEYV